MSKTNWSYLFYTNERDQKSKREGQKERWSVCACVWLCVVVFFLLRLPSILCCECVHVACLCVLGVCGLLLSVF